MFLSKNKLKNPNISLTNLSKLSFFKKRENIILLQERALTYGLPSQYVMKLVNLIGSKDLNSSEKKAIINCIIPSKSIPKGFLLEMTCHLTNFKLDCDIKVDILKRIIAVRPFVNTASMEKFFCVYEIFLKLLHFEMLRPYVVYLLYSFTIKELVTPDRIYYFDKLCKMWGTQPWLTFMLSLYSKLQPRLVREILPDFKPDLNNFLAFYPSLFEACHALNGQLPEEETYYTGRERLNSFHFEIKNKEESEGLEDTGSLHMHNDKEPQISDNVLSIYNSFEEVYRKYRTLRELPPEKILNSQLRRLVLTSSLTKQTQMRVFDYIFTSLYSSNFDFAIPLILDVLQEIQIPSIPLSNFIKIIIKSWDGFSNLHGVLEIVSYQEICSFDKIIYTMEILRETIKTASVDDKCYFLFAVNKMYQNWTLLEHAHSKQLPCEKNYTLSSEDILLAFDRFRHFLTNEIYKLGSYIDLICDEILSDSQFHPCVLIQVLLHYEKMSYAHMRNENLILHLPTSSVFTSAMFSLSSLTLENFCRLILTFYTEVYSDAKRNHSETNLAKRLFSSCLYDLVNFLWIEKGYEPSDNTCLPTTLLEGITTAYPDFKKFFLIDKHPALLLKTIYFCRQHKFIQPPSAIRSVKKVNQMFVTYISKDKYFEYFFSVLKFFIQKYPVSVED